MRRITEALTFAANLLHLLEVEPPLEAFDLRFVGQVLADAVPGVLSKRSDEILEFFILKLVRDQFIIIFKTYLGRRPNNAICGRLVFPVALSLPRQALAALVDAWHVTVQLCLVVVLVLNERAFIGFEFVIGAVNQVLQGLHVQTILDASLVGLILVHSLVVV